MAQNIKPRYEVERVEGVVTVTKYRRNAETGMNEQYTEQEPYGFNVYFPHGHSIRVRDEAELHRLGYDVPPELIDMDSGDPVGQANLSLKRHVQRTASGKGRADVGAVDAAQGG